MIGEKTANPSKEKRKKRKKSAWAKQVLSLTHRLYSTTHTVQQRLDTPGISSLRDMGERGHKNKLSFFYRLRKNLNAL